MSHDIPHNIELELQLLAGCLVDPDAIDRILVGPQHWFLEPHADLWLLLQDMRSCGDPVDDVLAVGERMKIRGIWEKLGGLSWLSKLFADGAVHRLHVDYYARELVRLANLRRLLDIAGGINQDVAEKDADPQRIASKATAKLASRLEVQDDVYRLDALADQLLDELRQPKQAKEPLFTGWPAFDVTFGPFVPGESVIIGARSSIGKTAAMLQTAIYQASHNRPVLFASLEMTVEQVRDRILCALASIDATKFRSRKLEPDDMIRIEAARRMLDGWPLWIWSPRGKKTVSRVASKARSVKAEHGLRLLCIDYLTKLHPEDSHGNREEQVAALARGVKDIAIDLDIPVITGSQLSRKADSDEKEVEPSLHHLRESGAVEQEADIVIFVHRRTRTAMEGKFIVAKFRQGTPGELEMTWNPMVQEFTLKQDAVENSPNYDTGWEAWNRGS